MIPPDSLACLLGLVAFVVVSVVVIIGTSIIADRRERADRAAQDARARRIAREEIDR